MEFLLFRICHELVTFDVSAVEAHRTRRKGYNTEMKYAPIALVHRSDEDGLVLCNTRAEKQGAFREAYHR
jgi:hypothetical protein